MGQRICCPIPSNIIKLMGRKLSELTEVKGLRINNRQDTQMPKNRIKYTKNMSFLDGAAWLPVDKTPPTTWNNRLGEQVSTQFHFQIRRRKFKIHRLASFPESRGGDYYLPTTWWIRYHFIREVCSSWFKVSHFTFSVPRSLSHPASYLKVALN